MFKTILSNFHLEKIFWIIRSRLKYMLLAALILAAGAGTFAFFSQTATYVTKISFYVYSNPDYVTDTGVNLSSSDISQAKTLLDSYMQIINSNTFLREVIKEAGLEDSYTVAVLKKRISATAVENTAVFNVNVYDEDPVNAMNIANTIGELAPDKIISIVKSGGIEVLDQAELPTVPFASTSVLKYAVLGGGAGFFLVAFFSVCKGLTNTVVRRKYEIEDLFTIPILGDVPQIEPGEDGAADPILKTDSPFALKEAYNNIRANLLFTTRGEKCPVYVLTSADGSEGKTVNALNLAWAYAQLGKKTLLIDADMRKSRMAEFLGIESREGLSEFLAQITADSNLVHQSENLDIILSGSLPINPAELLASRKWSELLEASKNSYDVIFVDLPPLGIVSDALSLAQTATAYILVVRENVTKFDREEMIVQKLEPLNANICGFIYNGISQKSPDYGYKNYGKEYTG